MTLSREVSPYASNASISSALVEHKVYLSFCFSFFVLSYLFLKFFIDYTGYEFILGGVLFFLNLWIFSLINLSIYVCQTLWRDRPEGSPIMHSYRSVRRDFFSNGNGWRMLTAAIGISLVISAFLVVKASIPKVIPFSYDIAFEELDRTMHFGFLPWDLLQPLLGYEWVTLYLHKAYYLWFPAIYATFFWQVASRKNNQLRMQFIFSFVACWALIGGVMATLLSSAGPIYFTQVLPGSSDVYGPAMGYLQELNEKHGLYMFEIKEILWNNYVSLHSNGPVKGISAMPSMHVSIAFLLALFGWRHSRLFGIVFSIFFVTIFLGSIHLLWHYAIDGYVSILATAIIWIVCGKISKLTYENNSV